MENKELHGLDIALARTAMDLINANIAVSKCKMNADGTGCIKEINYAVTCEINNDEAMRKYLEAGGEL